MWFNKYPCIRQFDFSDCGAACIATISQFYGLKISIAKIRDLAGVDKSGTTALGLVKASKLLGFDSKGIKVTFEELLEYNSYPCIASVLIDNSLNHYVVIYEIKKDKILISDPDKGLYYMNYEEFKIIWQEIIVTLSPNENFKVGIQTKNSIKRYIELVIPYKILIIKIFLLTLIITALGMLGALYYKNVIDNCIPKNNLDYLNLISISFLFLGFSRVILTTFRQKLLFYLSQKLDYHLMLSYFSHVLKLPMRFFTNRKTGEIISRFNDAFLVREAISGALLTLMIDTLMVIAGGFILFNQNHQLFLITIVMIVLYIIILYTYLKPIEVQNREVMENRSKLTSYLVESLNGIETIKAFTWEERVSLETKSKFLNFLKSSLKLGNLGITQSTLKGLVQTLGELLILWVGAYNVIKGNLTLGGLISFNTLLIYFINPVENLINLQQIIQTAKVSSDRLGEVLELSTEDNDNSIDNYNNLNIKYEFTMQDLNFTKINYESNYFNSKMNLNEFKFFDKIQFEEVSFRYGWRNLIFKNLNLTIFKGDKIAFVGESGSGKSSLIKLLLKYYSIESGNILIDNQNISEIDFYDLRNKIAYVPQEVFLFSGSILSNLIMDNKEINEKEVMDVCKLVGAHDFIERLPLQYQTQIAENGVDLSGGQKQRLSIARALLRKPEILILDEATSNLDSLTEKIIEEVLLNLEKSITLIIISHRLSFTRKVDKIFVMKNGQIVEEGKHSKLLASGGYYYDLWRSQM